MWAGIGLERNSLNDINTRIENIRKGIEKRAAAMKAKVKKQGFQFKPLSDKQKKSSHVVKVAVLRN